MCEFYACLLSPLNLLLFTICCLKKIEEEASERKITKCITQHMSCLRHEMRVNNKNRNLCEY